MPREIPFPAGAGWPSDEQRLLLRAALLPGDRALAAWREWRAVKEGAGGLDGVAWSLMPLLYRNLPYDRADSLATERERLRQACMETAAANLVLFGRTRPVLQALAGAGFQTLLLKGSALATLYYPEKSLRPMADIDLLVRTSKVEEVISWLEHRGWHPRPRRWERFNATYRQVVPSHEFTKDRRSIDLHWHLLPECCRPQDDDDLWDAAVPFDFQGIPALALGPADQLLHVCVHGARRSSAAPLRWLADAAMIVRHADPAVDWERLVAQARRRGLVLPIRDALSYIREHLDGPVPEAAMAALAASPTSRSQRREYRCKRQDRSRKPIGYLPILWFDYLRWADAPRFPRNILGFVPYLFRFWGAEDNVQKLQCLWTLVRRRLGRLRSAER